MTSSVRPSVEPRSDHRSNLGPTIKPVIRTFSSSFTVPVFKTMVLTLTIAWGYLISNVEQWCPLFFFIYSFFRTKMLSFRVSLPWQQYLLVCLVGKSVGGDGEFIGNWVKKCIRSVGLSYVGYSHLHHLHRWSSFS